MLWIQHHAEITNVHYLTIHVTADVTVQEQIAVQLDAATTKLVT